jgi:hypothetical protein
MGRPAPNLAGKFSEKFIVLLLSRTFSRAGSDW